MIERYSYRGDPSVGFFITFTGDYAVTAPELELPEFLEHLEKVESFVMGTRFAGLLTAGADGKLLVPPDIRDRELDKIRDSGLDAIILDSRQTALGNLVLANSSGAIISERLSAVGESISSHMDVEVEEGGFAGVPTPGATAVANGSGAVIHRDSTEEEAERVKEVLELDRVKVGTVNLGSPYVGTGAVAASGGALVGERTSGPEIGRLDQALMKRG